MSKTAINSAMTGESMLKIRWGLLSTAHINRRLIPALRGSRRGELVAIASRSLPAARAYADQWKIPLAFGSYEEMLSSGKIDAVYISLPNHLHAQWSIRALQAGLHVLCEKPLALSLSDVDAMTNASRENNRCLAEAFMYRHHPQTKIVAEWVSSGRLGKVVLIRAAFAFALQDSENVRMIPEFGGGSLWDIGCYPVSLAQLILGEAPEWVSAAQVLGPSGIDETFSGQMRYTHGALAQFTCSFHTPFFMAAEILGEKGRLELKKPFLGMDDGRRHLTYYSSDGESQVVSVPKQKLYLGEVEDMHAAILDGTPNLLTLEESRCHVQTILALYESARQGQSLLVNQTFTSH